MEQCGCEFTNQSVTGDVILSWNSLTPPSIPPHSFLYAWHFVIQSWLHNHSFNNCQLIMSRSTSTTHAQWDKKKKSFEAHCHAGVPTTQSHSLACGLMFSLPSEYKTHIKPTGPCLIWLIVVLHNEGVSYSVMKVKQLYCVQCWKGILYFFCLAYETL